MKQQRIDRLERRVRPRRAARKPLEVVVRRPGDPAPAPTTDERARLIINVVPSGDGDAKR